LFEAIPEVKDIFVNDEWYDFLCTFKGHHTGLSMLFTHTFDGFHTMLGDTWIHVIEHFIRAVYALSLYGD
jgi:hypothetical protein